MLVHDDCLWINWKMAVVENLVKGNDRLVRSVRKWSNQSASKLSPRAINVSAATGSRRLYN